MDEREIEKALRLDLSKGTEGFRDELLEKCLGILRSEGQPNSGEDFEHNGFELCDDELDMLAAAGDPTTMAKDG